MEKGGNGWSLSLSLSLSLFPHTQGKIPPNRLILKSPLNTFQVSGTLLAWFFESLLIGTAQKVRLLHRIERCPMMATCDHKMTAFILSLNVE
jgi:hypothetical protein